jgi:hypothetical protein
MTYLYPAEDSKAEVERALRRKFKDFVSVKRHQK